jgi:hypothetical protein
MTCPYRKVIRSYYARDAPRTRQGKSGRSRWASCGSRSAAASERKAGRRLRCRSRRRAGSIRLFRGTRPRRRRSISRTLLRNHRSDRIKPLAVPGQVRRLSSCARAQELLRDLLLSGATAIRDRRRRRRPARSSTHPRPYSRPSRLDDYRSPMTRAPRGFTS